MASRAENLDRSRAWWDHRRARGICAVCNEPLETDRSWPVHRVCARLVDRHFTYAQIRAMSPAEREDRARLRRRRVTYREGR